jgi:2-polyprenyl-3-methyl-5-hydroxy-6-metoxy-1,4-benzoquinol methylase
LPPILDRLLNPYHYNRLSEIFRLIETGKTVLDVGCDGGELTIGFLKKHELVVGVDRSFRQILIAKANSRGLARVEFLVGEASYLSFPDESFDIVTSLDVVEHVEDDYAFLSEVHRVLKPGGFCLITTPNRQRLSSFVRKKKFPYKIGEDPRVGEESVHVREYTKRELKALLETCGFHVERMLSTFLGFSFLRGALSVGLPAPILQAFCYEIIAKARKPESKKLP